MNKDKGKATFWLVQVLTNHIIWRFKWNFRIWRRQSEQKVSEDNGEMTVWDFQYLPVVPSEAKNKVC